MSYHRNLAITIAVLLAGLALGAALTWRRRSAPAPLLLWSVVVEGVLVVQATLGLVLYGSGHRPASGLHWLYGVLVLLPLPIALTWSRRPDRRAPLVLAGCLAGLLFVFRSFATGS